MTRATRDKLIRRFRAAEAALLDAHVLLTADSANLHAVVHDGASVTPLEVLAELGALRGRVRSVEAMALMATERQR